MPSTIFTTTSANDVTFNITAESGILLESYSADVTSKKVEQMDADGEVVAVAYHDVRRTIKIEGAINGSEVEIATILTVANDTGSFGISGGTILVDSVGFKGSPGTFGKVSIAATQYGATLTEV
jgi:flagellar hook assembly protein FlgD